MIKTGRTREQRKISATISSLEKTKTIAIASQEHDGELDHGLHLHKRDAGGVRHLRRGEGVCRVLRGGCVGVGPLSLGCPGSHCQADAACLSQGVMWEQEHGSACFVPGAMEEQGNVVEDYMGEKEGMKRHGSLYNYDTRVLMEWELQSTHHKRSSVYDKAYQGDVLKLFDEAYKGNVFELAVSEGKYYAMDVVKEMGVEKGQEEDVMREKILQMLQESHLSTLVPSVYWIAQYRPVKSSPEEIVVSCKPVL
jgi:hypothetical protein